MMLDLSRPARLMVVTAVFALLAGATVAASELVTPQRAIEQAAFARLGPGVVTVEVSDVVTSVEPQAALVAVPDPSATIGQRVRFALMVNGRRRGGAVALVQVRARVTRAAKPIERGQQIDAESLVIVEDSLDGARFARLPQLGDVVGTRARRDIAPGVMVESRMVTAPFDVQNGDRVTVGVTVGRVHVTGEGLASGSGYAGDIVHVIQPGRRGLLKARIKERGVVEVMP